MLVADHNVLCVFFEHIVDATHPLLSSDEREELRPNRVYLAGPDLFFPDANERYARLKALCAELGLVGVSPLDGAQGILAHGAFTPETATQLYQYDLALLKSCDAVVCNLVDFRGLEPDSGTVFELAYATALGMPTQAYGPVQPMRDRIVDACGVRPVTQPGDAEFDARHGLMIENFGLSHNLMLSCSTQIHDSAQRALAALASLLRSRPQGVNPSLGAHRKDTSREHFQPVAS